MIENNKYEQSLSSRATAPVRVRDGLTYLLVGGGIGAVLALLFAPKSGTELRSEIADATRKGYDATLEKANALKGQSADVLQLVKDKAETAYNFASTKLNAGSDAVSDAVSATSDAVTDGIDAVRKEADSQAKQAGVGRKSASIF